MNKKKSIYITMKIMRSLPSHNIRIILAGTISFVGQGILLAPDRLAFLLQYLPVWGTIALGTALFIFSILIFTTTIRIRLTGYRVRGTLIALHAITFAGIYFLLNGFASHLREVGFVLTSLVTILTAYGIFLTEELSRTDKSFYIDKPTHTKPDLTKLEKPNVNTLGYETNLDILHEQVASTIRNLSAEKHRTIQLTFLNELSQQLETELDPPVAAQLAVNTLERAMESTLVFLYSYDGDNKEFVSMASAGKMTSIIPAGYRQSIEMGVLGRIARLKKAQVVNDTRIDPDFIAMDGENTLSEIAIPILQYGQLKGAIRICSDKKQTFSSMDVTIAEDIASELTRAWERSSHNQRLTELIQAGISLTTLLDPQAAVQEIAVLARQTLDARFVFITLLDQQGNFSRTASAGDAPKLLSTLNLSPADEPLIQAALNASKPFRVRDLRKYINSKNLELDHPSLRSALAIPIRLHRLSIGTILAFGKQDGVFFSENDESLADLLASQAAASIESSWLYQELRNTLSITSMLYQLSVDVIQTEELSNAAELIAQAAHRATNARETGILLLTREGDIQAEVELDSKGFHSRGKHPMETVNQAIETGQSIFLSAEKGSLVCYPLMTRARTVGALWMDIPESHGQNFANIQTLANQAAVTLERSILLSESRRQAKEIEAAYEELQESYDQTLSALMSTLDARDRETEGHSTRVSRLACLLGEKIGLTGIQLKALERGALLHDIGKIGISDTILHKPGKLTDEEWKIMRVHPDIGARIVERIPFLQDSMPVVRYHHERWDGSGYPLGLKEKDIPLHARIFSVVDVFDALTSRRSYRKKSSPDEAVDYIREQSGILFDPEIVEALSKLPYEQFIEGEKIV